GAFASWFDHCLFEGIYTNARESYNELTALKEYRLTLKVEKATTISLDYDPCDRHIGKEFEVVLLPEETQGWPNIGPVIVVEYQLFNGMTTEGVINHVSFKLIDP